MVREYRPKTLANQDLRLQSSSCTSFCHDRRVALRLLRIIRETLRDPAALIGKPEPLRGELRGLWSRRLTQEHRVVYQVAGHGVRFVQARYHY